MQRQVMLKELLTFFPPIDAGLFLTACGNDNNSNGNTPAESSGSRQLPTAQQIENQEALKADAARGVRITAELKQVIHAGKALKAKQQVAAAIAASIKESAEAMAAESPAYKPTGNVAPVPLTAAEVAEKDDQFKHRFVALVGNKGSVDSIAADLKKLKDKTDNFSKTKIPGNATLIPQVELNIFGANISKYAIDQEIAKFGPAKATLETGRKTLRDDLDKLGQKISSKINAEKLANRLTAEEGDRVNETLEVQLKRTSDAIDPFFSMDQNISDKEEIFKARSKEYQDLITRVKAAINTASKVKDITSDVLNTVQGEKFKSASGKIVSKAKKSDSDKLELKFTVSEWSDAKQAMVTFLNNAKQAALLPAAAGGAPAVKTAAGTDGTAASPASSSALASEMYNVVSKYISVSYNHGTHWSTPKTLADTSPNGWQVPKWQANYNEWKSFVIAKFEAALKAHDDFKYLFTLGALAGS